MDKFDTRFYFIPSQLRGTFVLLIGIIILQITIFYLPKIIPAQEFSNEDLAKLELYKQNLKTNEFSSIKGSKLSINQPFDPNEYSLSDWVKIGFSEKQSHTILKYKKSLGGFKTKLELKSCYVISDSDYTKLSPYIRLKKVSKSNFTKGSKLSINKPFDPNEYSLSDWVKIGFSEKQSHTILKYKKSLGGFKTKLELKSCYVVSDSDYAKLSPYIRLKKVSKSNFTKGSKLRINKSFDPNEYSLSDWVKIGFSEKQSHTILKYKKSLGGFKTKLELKSCYVISDSDYTKLSPYIRLKKVSKSNFTKGSKLSINKPFDPNKYSLSDWIKIGFSEKQSHTILKYKKSLGGFKTKLELKSCYVISDSDYAKLSPYIRLKKVSKSNFTKGSKLSINKPFDPNEYSLSDWVKIGFSEKQSHTILKYKKSLGGFKTKLELKSCYVISDSDYAKLSPYIKIEIKEIELVELKPFNPNKLSKKEWISLGFTARQAQTILNFKSKLGRYKSKAEFKRCYAVSEKAYLKLEKYLIFD